MPQATDQQPLLAPGSIPGMPQAADQQQRPTVPELGTVYHPPAAALPPAPAEFGESAPQPFGVRPRTLSATELADAKVDSARAAIDAAFARRASATAAAMAAKTPPAAPASLCACLARCLQSK